MTLIEKLQDIVTREYDQRLSNSYEIQHHIRENFKRGFITQSEMINLMQEQFDIVQTVYAMLQGFEDCINLLGYTITGGLDEHKVIEMR